MGTIPLPTDFAAEQSFPPEFEPFVSPTDQVVKQCFLPAVNAGTATESIFQECHSTEVPSSGMPVFLWEDLTNNRFPAHAWEDPRMSPHMSIREG